MDQTAIRFVRWSWIAGILLFESAQVNAQTPEEPPSPVLQPPRLAASHGSPYGAHTSRQDDRLSREFRRAAARLLRQRTIGGAGCQGRHPSIYALSHRFSAGNKPALADRRIAVQHHGDSHSGLVRPDHVEWTPEQPELAQSRRQAIVEIFRRQGQPILADRVVIAPSPYPGAMGVEAAHNFGNTIGRSQMSAPAFTLPPTESAAMGVR